MSVLILGPSRMFDLLLLQIKLNLMDMKRLGLSPGRIPISGAGMLTHARELKWLALLPLFFPLTLFAQDIRVKGTAKDASDKAAVEFVNVVLRTTDSLLVTGISTDDKGAFTLERITEGDYLLILSAVGYDDNVIELDKLHASVDLGDIYMEPVSVDLGDVTVTASNIVNKADRKIVFPNQQQLSASTNGINLLNTLQLPRINVNLMDNTVSLTTKESLQLRVNGVKVTEQELMAIQPQDIIRIEYIENPGLRYENAGAVLNYIVRRYETGGAVSFNLLQSPHKAMGNYNFSSKLSYKKSEFGINYMGMLRHFDDMWREKEERFLFEDGRELIKQEIPEPGLSKNDAHQLLLNYNIQPNEDNYVNISVGYARRSYGEDFYSLLKNNWYPDQTIQMKDLNHSKNDRPWIDLYWSRSLKNKQSLVLNAVTTYIRSDNVRTYQEMDSDGPIIDVLSLVKGDKYSFIGEAIYEKEFSKGRLSGGIRHTQASVNNKYSGTLSFANKMKEANTYAYAQYAGKIKKFDYSLGVGVYRSWLKQEGFEEYESYTFRPTISLSYLPTSNFYIRFNGSIENYSPSLADISATDQYIDSLQIQRGNPYLLPYDYYKFSLNSEYKFGKSSLSLWGMYMNFPDAIMEDSFWENGKLIRTNNNQKQLHQLMGSLTFKTRFFRDIFNLSLTGGGNYFVSEGHVYRHTYTNWYFRASLFANYKQWSFLYEQYSAFNTFWGEQMNGGENGQTVLLSYKHKNWVFGAGMFNPFTTTKYQVRNYNRYASSNKTSSIGDASHMFILQLSWNFNFGRKRNEIQKRLNNSDTDAGIMKVSK